MKPLSSSQDTTQDEIQHSIARMSYAGYWAKVPFTLPQGLGVAVGGWLLLNVFNGRPTVGKREVSMSEWNATPVNYLQHPEQHHVAFPKIPGQAHVEDGLTDLQHRAAHAKGHAHH